MGGTGEQQGKSMHPNSTPRGLEGPGVCQSVRRTQSHMKPLIPVQLSQKGPPNHHIYITHTCPPLLPSPHTPRRATLRQAGHPTQLLRRRSLEEKEQQQEQGGNNTLQQGSPSSRSWVAWPHGLSRVRSRAAGWSCCGTAAQTPTGSECFVLPAVTTFIYA
jgi:hypothetical protein